MYLDGEVLGKPADEAEAKQMLRKLSGKTHQVVTGVTLKTPLNLPLKGRLAEQDSLPSREGRGGSSISCASVSQVTFAQLPEAEIDHYVTHYRPLDKAGAYGIQEWIGYIGVTRIEGSYFNVMGLPVQRLYSEMKKLNLI